MLGRIRGIGLEPEPAISKADTKKAKKDAKKGGKKNKGKKAKAVDAKTDEAAVVAQNPLHQDDDGDAT